MPGVRTIVRRARTRLTAGVLEVRSRPLHAAMAAAVIGLLAGPRAPLVLLSTLLVCPIVAGSGIRALALVGALLAGAVLADARLAALDRSALTGQLGHAATVRVSLLEPSRAAAFGGRTAVVGLRPEHLAL